MICERCSEVNATPCCDSGLCEAPFEARGSANCVHCGAEMNERDGAWYRWDAPEDGGIPQGYVGGGVLTFKDAVPDDLIQKVREEWDRAIRGIPPNDWRAPKFAAVPRFRPGKDGG
jgi:hypothetical protein